MAVMRKDETSGARWADVTDEDDIEFVAPHGEEGRSPTQRRRMRRKKHKALQAGAEPGLPDACTPPADCVAGGRGPGAAGQVPDLKMNASDKDNIVKMSRADQSSSREVQDMFEQAQDNPEQMAAMLEKVRGHVYQLSTAMNACFVIRRIIEMPQQIASSAAASPQAFVIDELRDRAKDTAQNQHGCLILISLLKYSVTSTSASLADLVERELLEHAVDLVKHKFGHFVMEAVLEHGKKEHQARVARAIMESMPHHNACYFIENVLPFCSEADQVNLVNGILTDNFNALGQCNKRHEGVRALLNSEKLPDYLKTTFRQRLNEEATRPQAPKNIKRLKAAMLDDTA